jgi:carbamoyltransferase
MSKIIGIHYGGHDSSVAYIEDGKIICAMEEEKLTGSKSINHFWQRPNMGLDFLRDNFNATINTVDHVVFALPRHMGIEHDFIGLEHKFDSFSHQKCHALGAYFTSGFKGKVIAMSHDGQGHRSRGKIYLCDSGSCEQVHTLPTSLTMSIAGIWGKVTQLLGWKMFKDEGKIVGMVSHGEFDQEIYDYLIQCLKYEGNLIIGPSNGHPMFEFIFEHNLNKNGYFDSVEKRNNLAFTLEILSEQIMYQFLKDLKDKYPDYKKITFAGGIFANVKLNQYINNTPLFDEIFIHPSMGDGGLALGAAICKANELGDLPSPTKLDNVFFGSQFNKEYWDNELLSHENTLTTEPVSFEKIASLINDGKIVGVFVGKTEYGPRALGNRSIICRPTDKDTHTLLNTRLKRTEIMPFAPSILEEHFFDVFSTDKSKYAAEFMTLCYNTKDSWVEMIPAVIHQKDGTARPQCVNKQTNSHFYNIISEYYKLSGIPLVLNTSFNSHGEPINNYPHQVLKHLLDNSIDYIITEDYIINKKI